MKRKPESLDELLDGCQTLMLDMDGTLLDLAYDNYMWLEHIPAAYAQKKGVPEEKARAELYATFKRLEGTLDWYCLEHWSESLDLDVVALHREQRQRIGFLPGAREFLERVAAHHVRLLLVSNSHRHTLGIKTEVTDIVAYFDAVYLSHDLGYAKEDRPFWETLMARETFNPATTVFVDDNVSVLKSARNFGLQMLLHITRPDTRHPARPDDEFVGIEGLGSLLATGPAPADEVPASPGAAG